jgi:competence protein ComK
MKGDLYMYEINSNTIALIPLKSGNNSIIEIDTEINNNDIIQGIINDSCKFFGSSYNGRLTGTKKILGVSYKAPIVIEESSDLIFFPTTSPRLENCAWLSLKGIKDYCRTGHMTQITLINNKKINLDISYKSFDNQILRAARLLMLINERKIRKSI